MIVWPISWAKTTTARAVSEPRPRLSAAGRAVGEARQRPAGGRRELHVAQPHDERGDHGVLRPGELGPPEGHDLVPVLVRPAADLEVEAVVRDLFGGLAEQRIDAADRDLSIPLRELAKRRVRPLRPAGPVSSPQPAARTAATKTRTSARPMEAGTYSAVT
jgi:hypothetical protein